MLKHLGNGVDFMLSHDREILTPLDDSIYQVTELKVNDENLLLTCESEQEKEANCETRFVTQLIRRARGLAPEPIRLHRRLPKDTFAAGGDLKAVFALGREELVYLSQYFGDLEDVRCAESREAGIRHMEELLEIIPEVTVGDLHPAYFSTQNTEKKIQHHHAHVASVIAEYGLEGKVLGVACDGTGYGTDGTIWGSEFLLCEEDKMNRVGHFSSVKLFGGDAGAKDADMTLYSYMMEARDRGYEVEEFFQKRQSLGITEQAVLNEAMRQKLKLQEMAWKQNINTIYSSSMGRLFDATAALLDICHYNSYEGECAIQLEQAAHVGKGEIASMTKRDITLLQNSLRIGGVKQDDIWEANSVNLLANLYRLKSQYSKEVLAYLFHRAVANAIVEITNNICEEQGIHQIALSGGTFINRILLTEVVKGLEDNGKQVYTNEKVPCGDGGIALGQMYLATFDE
jgi:hydrogenase maturation protein HypF